MILNDTFFLFKNIHEHKKNLVNKLQGFMGGEGIEPPTTWV